MMIHRKIYQRAEVIGVYYIFWLLFQFVPMFVLSGFASKLFDVNVTGMSVVIDMMWMSVVIGLFIHGMSLLSFNTVVSRMSSSEVSHRARSYYINPFVIVLLSFVIGLGVWFLEQEEIIVIDNRNLLFLIAAVIGTLSMWISNKIEWLIFRDYWDQ
jgi:hypothetical protein